MDLPGCRSLRLSGNTLITFLLAIVWSALAGCAGCGITEPVTLDDDDTFVLPDDDDATEPGTPTFENEDCSNGIDDDEDGDTDCADSDCADDPACADACLAQEEIFCGELIASNNGGPGHTDAIDEYGSCTSWDESGPEYTFEFTPSTTEEVTAVLTVAGHANLDIFVLEDDGDCDGDDCVAFGASTVHWSAQAGTTYLIAVDGYAGGQDDFTVELLCPSGGEDGVEVCFNELDDDGDGDIDCDDSDCAADSYCIDEICGNNLDDDGDGYVDCDDTECWGDSTCDPEDCFNGVDDNNNGLIDCDDSDCWLEPACGAEDCHDGIDNDGDFFIDCEDSDCAADPNCTGGAEICDNGVDDDGDGLVDCSDGECWNQPECIPEICDNGTDDDGDGDIDCSDTECAFFADCVGEICDNGTDDDGDGDVDCDDTECFNDPSCNAGAGCNPVALPVECDGVYSADTSLSPDATDVISQYGCTPTQETGDEIAYEFEADFSGEVTFTLTGLSNDLDLFGLVDGGAGCDPASCQDHSTSGGTAAESVTMTVTSGTSYYAVVDGWNNNTGAFTLGVICNTTVGAPEDCTNGVDDDGDGDIDCADFDCAAAPGCTGEHCSDGIDNDGDAAIDCADTDCAADSACIAENCADGIDNDFDTLIDCDDPECAILPSCGSENCWDNVDNDGDGDVDCDDADCLGDPLCNPLPPGGEVLCDNFIDDDADGNIDCADNDCLSDPICGGPAFENCSNGVDDDGDGLVDCADPSCGSDPACGGPVAEDCFNGIDDDGDGAVDCDDSNCEALAECGGVGTEDCGNNVDDDGDGDVDCDDLNCLFDIFCWILSEDCADGSDNDLDGAVDCADLDCVEDSDCLVEECNNGTDDDGDGDVDCNDSECVFDPACAVEDCSNGTDDDGDGLIDCADNECATASNCLTEDCSNGVDDDADGDVDCDDTECNGNPVCASSGEDCDNSLEDNGNGLVDCADPACSSDPVCIAEICWNGTDDDGDLAADCDDVECADSIDCSGETCWDGVDNDADGLVDCDDDDCIGWFSCDSEICDNGVDDDSDGLIDCDDDGCAAFGDCIGEECDNNIDDDLDGLVDCADPDCAAECTPGSEICTDGVDNDGDGAVDCNDTDCTGLPGCAEDCTNGIDDDGDGLVDMDDDECADFGFPEECADGLDNDADGLVDCADDDCDSDPACTVEVCGNGLDDDGDGDIDCDDSECAGVDPACGEVCDNGVDDDGDGAIDCDDVDCENLASCGPVAGVGGTCSPAWELECGGSDSHFNWGVGSLDVIDAYSCVGWDMTGPEYTYVIRPEFQEEITLTLSGMSEDLDIFLVSEAGGCDGGNCQAFGNNTITFTAEFQQYYVVVDGRDGAMSAFDIEMQCESTNEICDNGIDDDSDGLTDCDDPFCASTLDCQEICQEQWSLFCGQTDSYSTLLSGATNQVDSYSCSNWEETGPEFGYYFQAPADQANTVTITLNPDDPATDLDLFVMDDQGIPCSSDACIASGGVFAEFDTVAGADYWVTVDGYQGDAGAYSVEVDCEPVVDAEICDNATDDDGDGDVDCDDEDCDGSELCSSECESVTTISCGDYVFGDTSDPATSTDQVDGYPCATGNFSGRETAFEFLSTINGTVTWDLENQVPTQLDHDLFVLDGDNGVCTNVQCLEENGYGGNQIEFEAVAGHTYYLVVEGFNGAEGPFEAQVICETE